MHHSHRHPLGHAAAVFLAVALALALSSRGALAYIDANGNRIDDRIERVNALGWSAAFVNDDPAQKMRIGVENLTGIVYAVYVGYDGRPGPLDEARLAATGVSMVWPFQNIDFIESRALFSQIQLIAALPGVTRVEAVPVEYATNHYGSRVLRARDSRGLTASENYVLFPSARQELGLDGTGIVIAILDTGVNDDVDQINPTYPGHESLRGKFLGGGEFWCGQALCSTPINGISNPQDHGAAASSYHGTHVAGSAMGTGGPGGFFSGVAPGARLVDCKVLSDAGASVGGSTRGLDWCISNRNTLWPGLAPGSIWQGIDVVSMSLGSTECAGGSGTSNGSGASNDIVNAAVAAGMVLCIATGNDNSTDCIASPAASDQSIAVGASAHARTLQRADDTVTSFSNEGVRDDDGDTDHWDEMKPSVVAPGAGIISASGDPTTDGTAYSQLSGTSMATPHVSGCAALVLQANPALTPAQVRSILQNTAEHNVPTAKASGDRGQDPFGLDANYDPSSGWGLVDVYAAAKEALNSTSGVQVVQIRAIPQTGLGRIDFRWVTQREHPFQGFNVYRAPDVNGAPGTFVRLNGTLIAPAGDPAIEGDDNRTSYLYADNAGLTTGQRYWYRVEWVDQSSVGHLEPPVPASYGTLARIMTAFYSIVHDAVDNDLLVRIGSDADYDPGTLGGADFEVLGPGETSQDSSRAILNAAIPPSTATATLGTVEHFWSVGFRQGDGAEAYLPLSRDNPWFLHVTDAGYVNRTGRVTGFSLFVNDAPGSASGQTYVTNHQPMPQPTGEYGLTPAVLWIPEMTSTGAAVARFQGAAEDRGGVRLVLELTLAQPGVRASVYRGVTEDFRARQQLTAEPVALSGARFDYVDTAVEPGVTYHYWVQIHEADGTSFMNGPIAVTVGGATTSVAAPRPNPVSRGTVFEYFVGADASRRGPVDVSLALHDVSGRVVKTLKSGAADPGSHQARWDVTDESGRRVAPGMYYLRLRAAGLERSRPVVVVR